MASISDWRRRLNSGLLFDEVVRKILEGDHIEELCVQAQHSWRNSFWSPAVTLITFLLQVLSAEKTLRAAVASMLAQLASQQVEGPPSPDPSAYCQARRRLPLEVVSQLSEDLAKQMQVEVGQEY